MKTEEMIDAIGRSELAGRFKELSAAEREKVLSDYRLCSGAVSLMVALLNDRRLSKPGKEREI